MKPLGLVAVFHADQLSPAQDCVERCAQFVRYDREKLVLASIRRLSEGARSLLSRQQFILQQVRMFELGGALSDPIFQVGIQFDYLFCGALGEGYVTQEPTELDDFALPASDR